jgi:hypothetical protein
VILATGASYRRLGVPSLDGLNGADLFYGGPASEAHALSGKEAYVARAPLDPESQKGRSAGNGARAHRDWPALSVLVPTSRVRLGRANARIGGQAAAEKLSRLQRRRSVFAR